ncbi:MAG: hypothetical protein U0Q16_33865 [Bryobacteraceae bacterium]
MLSSALFAQMEGSGPRGGPTSVNVGPTQTITATMPPPAGSNYYLQFYLRVSNSNLNQPDHTCNAIGDPVNNKFYMESDGTFGSTPPWISLPGAVGGSDQLRENSQCAVQILKSRVYINPDRSATLTITVQFKNPLIPHSNTPCPAACDYYAPGGAYSVAERYFWVLGYTNAGTWDGWYAIGPIIARPGGWLTLWTGSMVDKLPVWAAVRILL